MKEKDLANKLWNEVVEGANLEKNRKDFISQYNFIISWVKDNIRYFDKNVLNLYNMYFLMEIDPDKYILQKQGFFINKQPYKLVPGHTNKLISIISSLSYHLFEMITISSDRSCPIIQGDLKYVFFESIDKKEKELVLECQNCSYTEHLNGTIWEKAGLIRSYPATKEELLENGIDVEKLIEKSNSTISNS